MKSLCTQCKSKHHELLHNERSVVRDNDVTETQVCATLVNDVILSDRQVTHTELSDANLDQRISNLVSNSMQQASAHCTSSKQKVYLSILPVHVEAN